MQRGQSKKKVDAKKAKVTPVTPIRGGKYFAGKRTNCK